MRKEIIKFEGEDIEVFYFSNPITHEEWHEAEGLGLVYSYYDHLGPDYWDDELCFCSKDNKEKLKKYNDQNRW